MTTSNNRHLPLEFEQPLANLSLQIEALEKQLPNNPQLEQEVLELHKQYDNLKKTIYGNLRSIDRLAIARHPQRPYTRDYLERFDPEWVELHGDRHGVDDPAMICGLVTMAQYKVMIIGTQKGRNIREKQICNFGMPQPEGYRKALRCFKHAQKFNFPIVTLIDTPGAYPGMAAEEHNQAQAIANNLFELASFTVPIISVILGEGGSGGALAIGFSNRILMLENSVYSVISPEGCASILWRSADKVQEACEAMKITATEIMSLGIVDGIIDEPLGGAHNNWNQAANLTKNAIVQHLNELYQVDNLEIDRINKFRKIGFYVE